MQNRTITSLKAYRLLTTGLMEPFVRVFGWVARFLGWDQDGVEMVIRGFLLRGGLGWRVGRNVQFVGPCKRFRFGNKIYFLGNNYLNANGPEGYIEIGDQSHFDQYCVLYGQGGLSIGKCCAIASGVIIYTQTNKDSSNDNTPVALQPTVYATVFIGDNCWLGAGVRILPGVRLGEAVHVGAGAVVTKDIPSYCTAAGIPAKILKKRVN